MQIKVYDRQKTEHFIEKVFGEGFVHAFYNFGAVRLFPFHLVSKLFGWWQGTFLSTFKIKKFIDQYQIDLGEYEVRDYQSFNDFFIRRFHIDARKPSRTGMSAFAEGRYLGFARFGEDTNVDIKGVPYSLETMLQKKSWARVFKDGPMFIARLCPVDYHRFHFPDDGEVLDQYRIHGPLHSVNPIALAVKSDILQTNERHITVVETATLGKLAMIEIGAMMVGKIQQTHPCLSGQALSKSFRRFDEKGYFLFGASCVVVIGEAGKWSPAKDILEQTVLGHECLVRLGENIAEQG